MLLPVSQLLIIIWAHQIFAINSAMKSYVTCAKKLILVFYLLSFTLSFPTQTSCNLHGPGSFFDKLGILNFSTTTSWYTPYGKCACSKVLSTLAGDVLLNRHMAFQTSSHRHLIPQWTQWKIWFQGYKPDESDLDGSSSFRNKWRTDRVLEAFLMKFQGLWKICFCLGTIKIF